MRKSTFKRNYAALCLRRAVRGPFTRDDPLLIASHSVVLDETSIRELSPVDRVKPELRPILHRGLLYGASPRANTSKSDASGSLCTTVLHAYILQKHDPILAATAHAKSAHVDIKQMRLTRA